MTDYTPAVFTRDNPVTKIELHNCFYHDGQYRPRMVIQARTEIGLNAPKYLLREGFIVVRQIKGVDYYCPTATGDNWLRTGLARFLVNHPDRLSDVREPPAGFSIRPARKTRQKPVKSVETVVAPIRRINRRRP